MKKNQKDKKTYVFCGFGIGGKHVGVFRYTEQILTYGNL